MSTRLKITYVGGGSRFVATLLHGLAESAPALRDLSTTVELVLLDVAPERAQANAQYAEIVARQAAVPLTTTVTDDQAAALEGADWILFSIGLFGRMDAFRARWAPVFGSPNSESTLGMLSEGLVYWLAVAELAEEAAKRSPDALFSTLANPTDVVARAVAARYGLRSCGICVEVPQLRRWIALQLGGYARDVMVDYVGVNHVGWVSAASYKGEDARPLLREVLPQRMAEPDWSPGNDWFADLFLLTGALRTSPYHYWPYTPERGERAEQRREAHRAFREAQGPYPFPWQDDLFAEALREGRMVHEYQDTPLKSIRMPYQYSDTRHTLGAIAVGLAGGDAGPVPLQVRNDASNPSLPAEAWLEVPTRITAGRLCPQTAGHIPPWALAQLRQIVEQRGALADWFAGVDPDGARKACLLWPDEQSLTVLSALDEIVSSSLLPAS